MLEPDYWVEVRKLQQELEREGREVYLVLLAPHERVVAADAAVAAKCLVDCSHRLATAAEVVGYRAVQAQETARVRATGSVRFGRGRHFVALGGRK